MVRVVRPSADPNEIREITIDVTRMMQEGDLRNNLLLQEGDIVYVPPTPLGWVGLRVQEVLFPTQPLLNAYAYPANANNTMRTYRTTTGAAATGSDTGRPITDMDPVRPCTATRGMVAGPGRKRGLGARDRI